MSFSNFTGLSWDVGLLNTYFQQLYDLRELFTTPGFGGATPKLALDGSFHLVVGATSTAGIGGGVDNLAVNGTIGFINQLNASPGAGLAMQLVNRSATGGIEFYGNSGAFFGRFDGAGNLTINSLAALGYGSGSGGSVTQATNKSTAVTLTKAAGRIFMNNAALAAGARVSFQFNNGVLFDVDTLIVVPVGSSMASANSYRVECSGVYNNAANISVTNLTGGTLSEALAINFTVLKGSTS